MTQLLCSKCRSGFEKNRATVVIRYSSITYIIYAIARLVIVPDFDMEAIAYVYLVLELDHGHFLVPHIQNSDMDIHLGILSLGIKTKS